MSTSPEIARGRTLLVEIQHKHPNACKVISREYAEKIGPCTREAWEGIESFFERMKQQDPTEVQRHAKPKAVCTHVSKVAIVTQLFAKRFPDLSVEERQDLEQFLLMKAGGVQVGGPGGGGLDKFMEKLARDQPLKTQFYKEVTHRSQSEWRQTTIADLWALCGFITRLHATFGRSAGDRQRSAFIDKLSKAYQLAYAEAKSIRTLEQCHQVLANFVDELPGVEFMPYDLTHPFTKVAELVPALAYGEYQTGDKEMGWVSLPVFAPSKGAENPGTTYEELQAIKGKLGQWRQKDAVVFDLRGNDSNDLYQAAALISAFYGPSYVQSLSLPHGQLKATTRVSQELVAELDNCSTRLPNPWHDEGAQLRTFRQELKTNLAVDRYSQEAPGPIQHSDQIVANPVKATVVVITDERVANGATVMADWLASIPGVLHYGVAGTDCATFARPIELGLPSKLAGVRICAEMRDGLENELVQTPRALPDGLDKPEALRKWLGAQIFS